MYNNIQRYNYRKLAIYLASLDPENIVQRTYELKCAYHAFASNAASPNIHAPSY